MENVISGVQRLSVASTSPCSEYYNVPPQTLTQTACILYVELELFLNVFILCHVMLMRTIHVYIPLLSKSADGSAENQMIVESDDFQRRLHPSLLYKFLRGELIYSHFSQLSAGSLNSN